MPAIEDLGVALARDLNSGSVELGNEKFFDKVA